MYLGITSTLLHSVGPHSKRATWLAPKHDIHRGPKLGTLRFCIRGIIHVSVSKHSVRKLYNNCHLNHHTYGRVCKAFRRVFGREKAEKKSPSIGSSTLEAVLIWRPFCYCDHSPIRYWDHCPSLHINRTGLQLGTPSAMG